MSSSLKNNTVRKFKLKIHIINIIEVIIDIND